ncbi:hypothetical protein Goshw_001675 [Gossypium schwendimanii]|uniref:Uncharacterized protein n=1 Tax=Gossypium schwendimanii TaxID=34291 RepID=A0A7J9N1R2_GOSSC|nr:hypothetical protein [Gossypium schwendimanii]
MHGRLSSLVELPAGSGFLARGDDRPGMQVGPKTH